MADFTTMGYTPVNGLRDKSEFPAVPASEDEARSQIQGMFDQVKDFVNDELLAELKSVASPSGAEKIGSAAIDDVTGETVWAQLGNLKQQINEQKKTLSDALEGSIDVSGILQPGCIDGSLIVNDAINSQHYASGSIDMEHLSDGCINGTKICDDAISSEHIAHGSIGSEHIADGAITETKIGLLAVKTPRIENGAVTTVKIAEGAVTTGKIVDGNVTVSKLADGSVITSKILDSNVTTAKIVDGAITEAKLLDKTVTAAKIADKTITAAKIADKTVTAAQIADATLTGAKIGDHVISAKKLNYWVDIMGTSWPVPAAGGTIDIPTANQDVTAYDEAWITVVDGYGVVKISWYHANLRDLLVKGYVYLNLIDGSTNRPRTLTLGGGFSGASYYLTQLTMSSTTYAGTYQFILWLR